jgi:MinD-like ATPase involved in chromosome partitioning or flagellar assembly
MPKIVSVHSFRHGTGNSNLAANLAVSIAQHGHRVGILDTDKQASGIHTLFGLDEDQTDHALNYYLWSGVGIQEATQPLSPLLKINHGEIAVMGGGICLTPSNIKINEIAQLLREGYDTSTLSQGISELSHRLQLDYLLIDTNPGLSEDTLLAIALSDILVLVLCLDQQNFQGIALMLDVAQKLGVAKILLVANQVLPDYLQEDVRQQLEATYGHPVAGVLPFSQELLTLASRDIFCLRYPDHPLSKAVRAIAQQITHVGETRRADALQAWLTEPPTTTRTTPDFGISMFDVLLLPDAERQLMNWIIRQGKATLSDCVHHTGKPKAMVESTLENLVRQGLLQFSQLADDGHYKPQFASEKQRLLPNQIWEVLKDNTPE